MKRPEIKIKKNLIHKFFDYFAGAFFISILVYYVVNFSKLPDEVPMHYNIQGEVDRYGSKWESIILPIITVGLWALMYFVEKRPHIMNMPERLNEENAEALYLNSVYMTSTLKNIILLIFSFLTFETIWSSLGNGQLMSIWFLPITLILVFGPMIYYVLKQSKIH